MFISIHGVLTDYSGKVLIHQTDARTPGIINRPLEPGVQPSDTLAAAFREMIGLIVHPVRLTGVYYRVEEGSGRLSLVYRCIMRGGEIRQSDGRAVAGFFDSRSLPFGVNAVTRRLLDDALRHIGGSPVMVRLQTGTVERLRRSIGSRPVIGAEPEWKAAVSLVLVDGQGRVGWVRPNAGERWRLPLETVRPGVAPWEAAAQHLRERWPAAGSGAVDLRLIRLDPERPALTLVFFSRVFAPVLTSGFSELAMLSFPTGGLEFNEGDVSLAREVLNADGPASAWIG